MCGFRKYPYLSHGRSLKILSGWGYQKQKFLKYGAKVEFQEGWGGRAQTIKPSVGGGMDIFSNNTKWSKVSYPRKYHHNINAD